MTRTPTPWTYQGRPFKEAPTDCIGFLYLITCTHPDVQRHYIGRKFMWFKFNTKTLRKESDWKTYRGSSKAVLADLAQYGLEHFTFEVVQLFKTKGGLVSGEIEALWNARVLHELKEDGTRLYYNESIGNIKFLSKEQVTEETRQKLRDWWTPERRAEVSKHFSGRIFTEEHREKLAAKWTPERKEAQIARCTGKSPSNEARQKMSVASKVRGNQHGNLKDCDILEIFKLLKKGMLQKDIAIKIGRSVEAVHRVKQLRLPRYLALYEQFKTTHN